MAHVTIGATYTDKEKKEKEPAEKPSRIELLLSRPALAEVNDVSRNLKQFGYEVKMEPRPLPVPGQ